MIPAAILLPKPEPARLERLQALLYRGSPFLTVEEAGEFFEGASRATIMGKVDEGDLRAVDISARWPDAERREVRVYRYSVCFRLLMGHKVRSAPVALEQAFLARAHPWVRREEVAALLLCTPRHVANLHKAGALAGPASMDGQAPQLRELLTKTFRASLLNFLEKRELAA